MSTIDLSVIVDFVNECGKKNHWEVDIVCRELCAGTLKRNMMGIGKDQEFRWRLEGHLFRVRVLDRDGLWLNIDDVVDLTHPDSLDKIRGYLE